MADQDTMSTAGEPNHPEHRLISLMLIEDDQVFRLGLITYFEQFVDLQLILEADSSSLAFQSIQEWQAAISAGADLQPVNLIVLSLDLARSNRDVYPALTLCQQLKASYPTLPILLLGTRSEPLLLARVLQAGANGFCAKGAGITEIVTAIRQVAAGQSYWDQGMQAIAQALTASPAVTPARRSLRQAWTPMTVLRRNLRRSGLDQIAAEIANLEAQLQYPDLSVVDQLVLTGRLRELRAARWLVSRLLATPDAPEPPQQIADSPAVPEARPADTGTQSEVPLPADTTPATSRLSQPESVFSLRTLRSALFDDTAAKLQSSLRNLTSSPLEIDILKEEKKRELLLLLLRKLEAILDELRFSQVQPDHLVSKQSDLLLDLWTATTTDFFGKYYTVQLGDGSIELVAVMLQDSAIVQTEILSKIPLVQELLAHLLFQTPLMIDDTAYAAGTVEAMQRLEMILQNLLIQVANAVIQPLLNRFGDLVIIKQTFYDKRLLSSREIERFRNNLSWKYRVEKFLTEPTAIFESRFVLLVFTMSGIAQQSIYSARNQELAQLSGVPLAVTLALEARDAISPRLRSAISFLGSGVVYVLTEVIGRGIGLVGRGIIKGIGNALQDPKINRGNQRWR